MSKTHLFLLLVNQAEVTVSTSQEADLTVPNMRTSSAEAYSRKSPCTAEAVSCDKSEPQEATQQFMTFLGAEQVHPYLGRPVLPSGTNARDNA